MSDLQIVLILLGFFIIVGVVFYNWRQEKQLRETIRNDFASPEQDVLADDFGSEALGEVRVRAAEPVVDAKPVEKPVADEANIAKAAEVNAPTTEPVTESPSVDTAPTADTESASSINNVPANDIPTLDEAIAPVTAEAIAEPATETAAPEDVVAAIEKPPVPLPADINPGMDLTAVLTANKAITGQALIGMTDRILKELGALVLQHGLDNMGVWHRIDDVNNQDAAFETVACSLQLVDRRGPVAKPLINKFEYAMEAIALDFDAIVAWRGEGDAVQRAVELDQFCIEVDQLVSVHVLQGDTPIHGTKFRGMAEANDLKLHHGKFYCVDSDNPDLVKYVLSSADEQPFSAEWLRQNVVRGVVFQVEIPKVENVELVFNQMIIVAQQMASSLGANMVDGNQRALGPVQIDQIKQQLKLISGKMAARGIPAGSPSSMRLFN